MWWWMCAEPICQVCLIDWGSQCTFFFYGHTYIPNMVKSTIIARVSDGLPLAASMDDEQVRERTPWNKNDLPSADWHARAFVGRNRVGRIQSSSQDHFQTSQCPFRTEMFYRIGCLCISVRELEGFDMAMILNNAFTCSYIIDGNACYLCICDKSYPRKLAFSYLEELVKEFNMSYGSEVDKPGLRPYAFVKFGMLVNKDQTRINNMVM